MQFLSVLSIALLAAPATAASEKDAHYYNNQLGRGVNMGNGLDAPSEGAWGFTIKEEYFPKIKEAGFSSVRIPIRWSAHAAKDAPFVVDEKFMARVEEIVAQALEAKLVVVINAHHYDEIFSNPADHEARLAGIWKQIAERFQKHDDRVYFELLNEPHDKLTDDRWNAMAASLIALVRKTNPVRPIIVGPGSWNSFRNLEKLKLPEGDRLLIATFHYYEPFEFTHQGASWAKGSDKWKGMTWRGTVEQMAKLTRDFDTAALWSKKTGRPIYLGEFGAYSEADMESRAAWTTAVVREAARRNFSTAYWEFGSGFGAFDPQNGTWREPLKEALLAK